MGDKSSLRVRFRNDTASPRTRPKRMWRLGSTHCHKLGEGGSQIQITDGAALEEICYEWFAAVRRNNETGHAGQFRDAPQFRFDVGSRTFGGGAACGERSL